MRPGYTHPDSGTASLRLIYSSYQFGTGDPGATVYSYYRRPTSSIRIAERRSEIKRAFKGPRTGKRQEYVRRVKRGKSESRVAERGREDE